MARFVLVSVCDREIMTEVFDSLKAATEQRNKEMIEWGRVPPEIFNQFEEYEEDGEYGFGKYHAYANDRCDFDWLIADIPDTEQEEDGGT